MYWRLDPCRSSPSSFSIAIGNGSLLPNERGHLWYVFLGIYQLVDVRVLLIGRAAVMCDPQDPTFSSEQEAAWFTKFLSTLDASSRTPLDGVTGILSLRQRCTKVTV